MFRTVIVCLREAAFALSLCFREGFDQGRDSAALGSEELFSGKSGDFLSGVERHAAWQRGLFVRFADVLLSKFMRGPSFAQRTVFPEDVAWMWIYGLKSI